MPYQGRFLRILVVQSDFLIFQFYFMGLWSSSSFCEAMKLSYGVHMKWCMILLDHALIFLFNVLLFCVIHVTNFFGCVSLMSGSTLNFKG